MHIVMQPLIEDRERLQPLGPTYTYEEHNVRPTHRLPNTRAPEIPRQPSLAPVKPARMPHILFYNRGWRNNLGPDSGIFFRGWHVVISALSKGTPRGFMVTQSPQRRPIDRGLPFPYGDQVESIGEETAGYMGGF